MSLTEDLARIVGASQVLTGRDLAPYARDWLGKYTWAPLCAVRPASTAEVSAIMALAHRAGTPVVPIAGNTGLNGGTSGDGAIMLSLERMNAIREVRPAARLAVVEAGVILAQLHDAAAEQDLSFPMTFGARGSARIGGMLGTNAGGSNVLRHGNTRDLVLGIEAVLADGQVMDLMGALHKDNSGYALKHLLIGSEGTLGVITAAVLKLVPKPRAHATAMVATSSLPAALDLLNRLQVATGGAVEAFEYMSRAYMEAWAAHNPGQRLPFSQMHDVTLLVDLGATAPRDVTPDADGQLPVARYLEEVLVGLAQAGTVLDAVVAQSEAQRAEMWARREAAAEVVTARAPIANCDIAVALDAIPVFLERMQARLARLDPEAVVPAVAHLGDGNIHYSIWPGRSDPDHVDALTEAVEDEVLAVGGSFSAEHGIGLSKLPSMRRRKDPVAMAAMRQVKAALDPKGILNPGKVLP